MKKGALIFIGLFLITRVNVIGQDSLIVVNDNYLNSYWANLEDNIILFRFDFDCEKKYNSNIRGFIYGDSLGLYYKIFYFIDSVNIKTFEAKKMGDNELADLMNYFNKIIRDCKTKACSSIFSSG